MGILLVGIMITSYYHCIIHDIIMIGGYKMENEEEFSIFVPISKSVKASDVHGRIIRGWASTSDTDVDGDTVLPSEINIKGFMSRGHINYEHKQGPLYEIGVPTDNTYIDPKRGLFVEAILFDDNPYADKMWDKAMRVSKGVEGTSEDNMLGFSIEGRNSHRDYYSPSILRNVTIDNIALTVNPKNKHATWQAFMKSLTTGDEIVMPGDTGGSVLRKQATARELRHLSYAVQDYSQEDWEYVARALDQENRFDDVTASLFLQIQKGMSRDEAVKVIKGSED